MNIAKGRLCPTAPFDFSKSTGFLGEFEPTLGEQQVIAMSLTKAVMIDGTPVVFRVENAGTVQNPAVDYTLFADAPITQKLQEAAIDRIGFFLSLYDDLTGFYKRAEGDPDFLPVVQKLYGFHQVKFLTPFENICWAILTQRNPIPMAQRMKAAITKEFGSNIAVEGVIYNPFPEAKTLAEATKNDLAELVQHNQKAEYLHAAASAFSQVDETFLRTGDYEEVKAWLLNIKGVGAWSASFVMIRGLGRTEHISTEKMLLGAASRIYGRTLMEKDLPGLAARYGNMQAYWAFYLRNAHS